MKSKLQKKTSAADILRLQRLLLKDKFLPDDFKTGILARTSLMTRDQIIMVAALLEDMQKQNVLILNDLTNKIQNLTRNLNESTDSIIKRYESSQKKSLLDRVRSTLNK